MAGGIVRAILGQGMQVRSGRRGGGLPRRRPVEGGRPRRRWRRTWTRASISPRGRRARRHRRTSPRTDGEVGKKLVPRANDRGNLREELCRVKGIFRTGAEEVDGYLVQAPLGVRPEPVRPPRGRDHPARRGAPPLERPGPRPRAGPVDSRGGRRAPSSRGGRKCSSNSRRTSAWTGTRTWPSRGLLVVIPLHDLQHDPHVRARAEARVRRAPRPRHRPAKAAPAGCWETVFLGLVGSCAGL